ncbi:MAG: ribosome small subunit-dependent GTPase A, partial [Oscillospiraceae bacterium]|nr:ribosome small subunit-dependent GTPase A [Oscillospiraceae bacterium]
VITKALSGFYYVRCGAETVTCRARGRFRNTNESPLVGDSVSFERDGDSDGTVTQLHPRRNEFIRPPVANIDTMVIVASAVIPVTEPLLIDRMAAIAVLKGAEPVICLNKCDMNTADVLFDTYSRAGFRVFRVSAETGDGTAELLAALADRTSAFTGNSGVGKSSILNALGLDLAVGEVSDKLGRGRHTTRHVELHSLPGGALIVDTPGFSSFDIGMMENIGREELERAFFDFAPFLGKCRFRDCAHVKEPDCAVLGALADGKIVPSRHESYTKLLEASHEIKAREYK